MKSPGQRLLVALALAAILDGVAIVVISLIARHPCYARAGFGSRPR